MSSIGPRDYEVGRYLTLAAKTITQIGVNEHSWRNLHLKNLLLLPLKSFSMTTMFEKCHSLKRCGSTLITIPWNFFRGSLNGLSI